MTSPATFLVPIDLGHAFIEKKDQDIGCQNRLRTKYSTHKPNNKEKRINPQDASKEMCFFFNKFRPAPEIVIAPMIPLGVSSGKSIHVNEPKIAPQIPKIDEKKARV